MELRGEGEGEMIPTVVIHDLHGQQAQPNNKRNRCLVARNRCLVARNSVSFIKKGLTVFNHTRDIVPDRVQGSLPDPGKRERNTLEHHTRQRYQ